MPYPIVVKYLRLTTSAPVSDAALRQRFPVALEHAWKNMVFYADIKAMPSLLNEEIHRHCCSQLADDIGEMDQNVVAVNAFTDKGWVEQGDYHSGSANIKGQLVSTKEVNWTFDYYKTPVTMIAECRMIVK